MPPDGSIRRRFLAACGVAATAGCTTGWSPATTTKETELDLGGADWPMFGRDAANAGHNPTASAPKREPEGAWETGVEGYRTLPAPVFVDGTVYVGSGTYVYAIDGREGTVRWRRGLEFPTHHVPPAVTTDGGTPRVVVAARTLDGATDGGGTGRLTALSGVDGAVEWTADLPVTGAPTVAAGRVYVASTDDERGRVHAFDAATGDEEWAVTVDRGDRSAVLGAPAVAGDEVYAAATRHAGGSSTGSLLALAAGDGGVRHRTELPGTVRTAPVIAEGSPGERTAFVATTGGTVTAVATADGTRRWRAATSEELYSTPVVANGRVYALTGGTVIAVDAADGDVAWRTAVPYTLINGLAATDHTLYLGGQELTAIAVDDGGVRWAETVPGGDGGWGGPIVVGDAVLVGACIKGDNEGGLYDNYLYALSD